MEGGIGKGEISQNRARKVFPLSLLEVSLIIWKCWYQKNFSHLNLLMMLVSECTVLTVSLNHDSLWTHPCVMNQNRSCRKKKAPSICRY